MDPVEKLGKFGSELKTLATDYGPAIVYIEGLTDDVKLINKRNQQFSDDYVKLFNTKKPSDTMMNGFSAAVLRFLSFLELECLKNSFDESKLAHDIPASMKLQYILQHASRYNFLPLHERFVKLTYENSGMFIHCWAESTVIVVTV
ncbi:hypothetical protein HDU78_011129, partial [Chytriomyces hyalinus]